MTLSMHTNEMFTKNIKVISTTNDHSMRSVAIFVLIIRDLTDLYIIRFVKSDGGQIRPRLPDMAFGLSHNF